MISKILVSFQKLAIVGAISLTPMLLGCSGAGGRAADLLNPFAEDGPKEEMGSRSLDTLTGGKEGGDAENARHALEVMGSYRRAQDPQPAYPVIQPAEVRLMWIPDHLNKAGDLVPAHYYYLRVLDDRWAIQDSFEVEAQLNKGSSGGGSATPWVYGGK